MHKKEDCWRSSRLRCNGYVGIMQDTWRLMFKSVKPFYTLTHRLPNVEGGKCRGSKPFCAACQCQPKASSRSQWVSTSANSSMNRMHPSRAKRLITGPGGSQPGTIHGALSKSAFFSFTSLPWHNAHRPKANVDASANGPHDDKIKPMIGPILPKMYKPRTSTQHDKSTSLTNLTRMAGVAVVRRSNVRIRNATQTINKQEHHATAFNSRPFI